MTKWKRFKHNFGQLVISIDQLGNNLFAFIFAPFSLQTWADETISCRCGRLIHRNPYKWMAAVIDIIFYPFQGPNHCVNAYKKEMDRYNFPPEMRN